MNIRLIWRLAGLVSVGGILLIVLLHTPPVKHYALEQAQRFLRSQGIQLEARALRYNLLTLTITLEDLALQSSSNPQLPPFFKTDHLYVNLSLAGLITRSFAVQDARMKSTAIQVLTDEQGRSNLPGIFPARQGTSSSSPVWYLISSLEIEDGSVSFEDRQQHLRVFIPHWKFELELEPAAVEHHVRFKISQKGQVNFERRSIPIEQTEINALLGRDRLKVKSLELSAGGARLKASGSLDHFSDPALDFTFRSSLDLEQISKHMAIKQVNTGHITADGSLVHSSRNTRISSQVKGRQVSAAGYDQIGFETRASWDTDSGLLRLDALSARLGDGIVEGKVALDVFGDQGHSAQTRLRNLDVQPVTRLIDLPFEVAARATGTVSLRWSGGSTLSGAARIQLEATQSRPDLDVLPVTGSFAFNSAGQQMRLSIASAEVLDTSLQGEVLIQSMKHLNADLQGRVSSIEPLLGDLALFLGRKRTQPLLPLQLGGTANFQARIEGTIANPRLLASVQAPKVQLGTMQDAQLDAQTELDSRRLVFRDLQLAWAGQTLSAHGQMGLRGRSPSLDFQGQVACDSVGFTLAQLEKSIEAGGVYKAMFKLGGTLKEPEASVSLSARDLRAYGELMGNLEAKARLSRRRAELTELHLEKNPLNKNEGHLDAQGTYQLETGEYALEAEVNNLTLNQLLLPGVGPLQMTLNLSAVGKGTVNDPQLSVQLDASALNVRNRLIGAVNGTASLANQQADFGVRVPRFNVASAGRVQVRAPYASELTMSIDQADLSLLGVQVADGEPLSGALSATVKGSGQLSNWRTGEIGAQVSHLEISAAKHQIRNLGTFRLSYQDGVFTVDRAELASEDSRIVISGSLPVNDARPPGSVEVQGNAELGTLLAFVPLKEKVFASGLLDFNASLQGSLDRLTPSVDFSLKEGFFYNRSLIVPVTEIGLAAQLQNGSFVLNHAQGQWALGSIQASGELPLGLLPAKLPIQLERKSGPARFALDVRGLQADAIHTLPRGVAGTVSVHVEGESPQLNLSALSANVVFEELRFQVAQYVVAQAAPSRISLRDGSARIDQLKLTGPTTQVEATGRADLGQPRGIDLQVTAALDAGVFTFMSEELRAAGATQVQLGVRGQWDSPEVSGLLKTSQGQFSLRSPRIQAENLDVLLRFAPGRVSVEGFAGNLNGGNLRVGGTIDYAGTLLWAGSLSHRSFGKTPCGHP